MKVEETFSGTGWSRLLTAGLCAILAAVVLMCGAYVGVLKTTIEEENDHYLREVSHHVAALVNYKVEANFQALSLGAENWNWAGDVYLGNRRLRAMAEQYGFQRVGVIDTQGRIVTTDGLYGNLAADSEVEEVLHGGPRRVLEPRPSNGDGQLTTLYLVPIEQDGQVTGAMYASVGVGQMRELLSVESFGGEGYSQIINSQGDFLVSSTNKNAPGNQENFFVELETVGTLDQGFTIQAMKNDLAAGRSGMCYYSLEGMGRRSLSYVKLDVEDWYLLSVVPDSVAGARSRTLIHLVIAVNVAIVVLFLLLILLTLWQSRKNRRDLVRIALVDGVTGGMNRPCFERRAGRAVAESPSGAYVLIALDIQGFKLINDMSGSAEGDRVLRYVHNVLVRHLEEGELVGRLSADNFSVLLKNRPRLKLREWLDVVVGDINSFNARRSKKYFLYVTAGVYEIDDAMLDMVTVQDRANVARKRSRLEDKSGQLFTCAFYSDVERVRLLREKEIDDRKEQALANGEFIVFLQPKVALDTGRVAGAEALVRWQDPERGLIPPDEFIPAFERGGFITRIDLHVFEETCRLLRDWMDRGLEPVPISVNLSRVHLQNWDFLDAFQAVRARYGVPAGLLEFEFTETVATESLEDLIRVAHRLHELGYRCALDDFGSGSSSLNTLKDVPVDVLKLDRAFFSGSGVEDERGRAVVESAVELARKLRMSTVSEGVETMAQVEVLRQAKCDMVQGFVFSRPIPAAEFERMAFFSETTAVAGKNEVSAYVS